jgi:hypothetical protein
MNVVMWERPTFDAEIFRCGKVYQCNSVIVTNFV